MSHTASIVCENDQFQVLGTINFDTAVTLWEQSLPLMAKSSNWLFDLSKVTSANSAALSLLLEWTKYANRKGRDIRFSGVPEKLAVIAKVGGLQGLLSS